MTSPAPVQATQEFVLKGDTLSIGNTYINLRNYLYFSVWQKEGQSRVTLWGKQDKNENTTYTIVYCETVTEKRATDLSQVLLSKLPCNTNLPDTIKEIGFINPSEWGKGSQMVFEVTGQKVQRLFLDQKTVEGKIVPERKAIDSTSKELNDWASGKTIQA